MDGWDDITSGLKDIGGMLGDTFDKMESFSMHYFDSRPDTIMHTEDKTSETLLGISSKLSLPLLLDGVVVLIEEIDIKNFVLFSLNSIYVTTNSAQTLMKPLIIDDVVIAFDKFALKNEILNENMYLGLAGAIGVYYWDIRT